jgi:hypothetical protein
MGAHASTSISIYRIVRSLRLITSAAPTDAPAACATAEQITEWHGSRRATVRQPSGIAQA